MSLAALIKGADWVLENAQKIGLSLGMAPFLVGVLIVGFGTSTPELVSSLFGMFEGATEIPAANAIGSNIANILLIIGASAIFSRGVLTVHKNLIELEIPVLVMTMFFFFGVAFDGIITRPESIMLLVAFGVYLLYSLLQQEEVKEKTAVAERPKISGKDIGMLLVGFVLLIGGAKYLIDSVLAVSEMVGISVGIITILAVAVGTSLPELLVSIKAALAKQGEISVGNIFGSNVFNALLVVGASGLVGNQLLDSATLTIALPTMLIATFFFVMSSMSNRIYVWEGAFYILAYALFVVKIFGWF